MQFRRQEFLGLALVFLLALTGQGMAVARGAGGPSGTLELCTGTGPVTVYTDENGEPTGPPFICPDWALTLLAHVATPEAASGRPGGWRRMALAPDDIAVGDRFRPRRSARAPPAVA
ncbi:hypothetical protein [Sedimentitalea xiamensis]|nr:hypothetical protein [Sedimentitalea xiamensis]